ncbi:replication protein RepA [Micrococcus endophyticus]
MSHSAESTAFSTAGLPRISENRLRLIEASSEIEQTPGQLAFSTRIWAQLSLPYKDPGKQVRHWTRRNGDTTITLSPGPAGYPYGVVARSLLTWMSTQAVRTRSRHLDPGPSLRSFMSSLGTYAPSGANQRRVMDQLHRLSTTSILIETTRDQSATKTVSGQNFLVSSRYQLTYQKPGHKTGHNHALIELSEDYFREVLHSPVPVLTSALGALGGSPMRQDLYVWLCYRMATLSRTTTVSWTQLEAQFGAEYRHLRQFKSAFLKNLEQVKVIYPKARVAVVDKGLRLHPSPTHVPKPAHRPEVLSSVG